MGKQAQKVAATAAAAEEPVNKLRSHRCRQTCPPDSTFSKSIVICSSFQTSLIIDQGPDTCCNWAARYWQNLCQRISLGSDCDEAQICTYVLSSDGFIVQALCQASCVDSSRRIGQSNLHGDPSAAVLEVLDIQKWNFDYDYINVQLIYLKIYSSSLPVFSTLYLRCYSINVK